MALADEHCQPIAKGTPPLTVDEAAALAAEVPAWTLGATLERAWIFPTFLAATAFVNQVIGIAITEDHHPDISISYTKVTLTLATHKIGGLSRNDFILAAKIDRLGA